MDSKWKIWALLLFVGILVIAGYFNKLGLFLHIIGVVVSIIAILLFIFLIIMIGSIISTSQNIKKGLAKIEKINRQLEITPQKAELYKERAIAKKFANDIYGAIEDLNIAINLNPQNHDFYYKKALIEKDLYLFSKAIDDINKAISIRDCNIYRAQKSSFEKEIEEAKNAIIENTSNIMNETDDDELWDFYSNRGDANAIIGNYEAAIEDYISASKYDKEEHYISSDIIYSYINLKRYDDAIQAIEGYMKNEKDDTDECMRYSNILKYIEKIR